MWAYQAGTVSIYGNVLNEREPFEGVVDGDGASIALLGFGLDLVHQEAAGTRGASKTQGRQRVKSLGNSCMAPR